MVGSPQQPERIEIPQVQAAISSVDFPADRAELQARVAERGVDERIVTVLGRLPDRRYRAPAEIIDAVRRLEEHERMAGPRQVAPGAPGSGAVRGPESG